MGKRRKFSNPTDEETVTVVDLLKRFQFELDEDDEDGKEVIQALQTVVRKFSKVKHIPFSDATVLTLVNASISTGALQWRSEGKRQAEECGGKSSLDALSPEETLKRIRLIRKHIAFETEAGCRILINEVMLYATTNLETSRSGVAVAPEFRISQTTLDFGGPSYGGVVDYLMVFGETKFRDVVVVSPELAFRNDNFGKSLTCIIYEAKPEKVLRALPQVVINCTVRCRQLGYTIFRGCVTTGEEWLFFIYNKNTSGAGGRVSYLPPIRLEPDLSGLPLILGMLHDWIENGQQTTMRFCDYLV